MDIQEKHDSSNTIMDKLENYKKLRDKIDSLCRDIERSYAPHIACRKGCDQCCMALSLFPVEAAAMTEAMRALPPEKLQHIRKKADPLSPTDTCPLLEQGECLLYEARPIICRTHGLPLLIEKDESQRIDFCPMNFQDLESLPGDAVINLAQLNNMLTVVNSLFVKEHYRTGPPPDRIPMRDLLLSATLIPQALTTRPHIH